MLLILFFQRTFLLGRYHHSIILYIYNETYSETSSKQPSDIEFMRERETRLKSAFLMRLQIQVLPGLDLKYTQE